MNQSEFKNAFNSFKANDQLKRKLKILLGIGCLGMLLVGGLIIWAGVATVQQVVKVGSNVNVQGQVQNIKGNIPKIPAIVKVGCYEKMQSLMSIQVWLETPLGENITSLQDACFGPNIK